MEIVFLNTIKSTGSYYSQLQDGQLRNVSTNVLYTNFEFQNGENVLSDMYIENGSFLRMDYATIGYTFPKWLEGKLHYAYLQDYKIHLSSLNIQDLIQKLMEV